MTSHGREGGSGSRVVRRGVLVGALLIVAAAVALVVALPRGFPPLHTDGARISHKRSRWSNGARSRSRSPQRISGYAQPSLRTTQLRNSSAPAQRLGSRILFWTSARRFASAEPADAARVQRGGSWG